MPCPTPEEEPLTPKGQATQAENVVIGGTYWVPMGRSRAKVRIVATYGNGWLARYVGTNRQLIVKNPSRLYLFKKKTEPKQSPRMRGWWALMWDALHGVPAAKEMLRDYHLEHQMRIQWELVEKYIGSTGVERDNNIGRLKELLGRTE